MACCGLHCLFCPFVTLNYRLVIMVHPQDLYSPTVGGCYLTSILPSPNSIAEQVGSGPHGSKWLNFRYVFQFMLLMVQKSGQPVEVGSLFIPVFTGFYISQVVQDFFHQQCHIKTPTSLEKKKMRLVLHGQFAFGGWS